MCNPPGPQPNASLLFSSEAQRLRVRIMLLEGELASVSGALRGIANVMRAEGEPERAAILEARADEVWRISRAKKEQSNA